MNKTFILANFFLGCLLACGDTSTSTTSAPLETPDSETEDAGSSHDTGSPVAVELSPEICTDPAKAQAALQSLGEAGPGDGGDSTLRMNQDQLQVLLSTPTEGPFYMLNLIKYREQALYADGRETDLSGREANALYAPIEFIDAIGGRVVYNSEVANQIDGDNVLWDDVAIVEYPCPAAFFAMTNDPDFQARAVHKDAGVEITLVMFTELQPHPAPEDSDQSEASFPPTDDDPSFDLMHVMDFHDIAQYQPDANEPERTGAEAWAEYQAGGGASTELGHYVTGSLIVKGTLIGQSTGWDEVQIVHMSSMAGFQALLDDETRQAGRYHRHAAIQNNYSMMMFPMVSELPYVDATNGGTPFSVTANGTGTVCQDKSDCPSDFLCLSDGSSSGFCTPEGCTSGSCEAPYLCCHGCSAMVASALPFEESACFPTEVTETLTNQPASCTCD